MLKKINNSGDTIVEVMIILAIVGAAIIGSTIAVNKISEDLQNANYIQSSLRLEIMSQIMEVVSYRVCLLQPAQTLFACIQAMVRQNPLHHIVRVI